MTDTTKVGAGAGAEWLLGGFALLRGSPLALGSVGLAFGVLSVLPALLVGVNTSLLMSVLSMFVQLVLVLLGPVLLGGFVYAVREADQGRAAGAGHLLQGFREGKALRLMAQLLPQFAVGVLAVILMLAIVGPQQLQLLLEAVEQAQGQSDPDPALLEDIAFGRMLLWALVVFVLGVVGYFFTFVASPQIMFEDRNPFTAMKRSFSACLRNLPAVIVFLVLLVIVAILLSLGAQLLALVVRALAGPAAMQIAAQLLMMMVFMPVFVGAMYHAWRQLLPAGPVAAVGEATPATGIEV